MSILSNTNEDEMILFVPLYDKGDELCSGLFNDSVACDEENPKYMSNPMYDPKVKGESHFICEACKDELKHFWDWEGGSVDVEITE